MSPKEFMEKFPHATKAEFYTLTDAHNAEIRGTCRVLVKNRSYTAPLGLTVDDDLENGARGVDEWIYSDGGDAFILKDFLITTQAKRNLSSRSGIGGVRSAT